MLAAFDLRAAVVEGVVDANGQRFDRRDRVRVRPVQAQARAQERAAAKRPDLLRAERARRVGAVVGAAFEIVITDAEILVVVVEDVEAKAQRLIEGDGVIDVGVDAVVVARRRDRQRFGSVDSAGKRDVDVRRLVRVGAVEEDAERGLVLDQRRWRRRTSSETARPRTGTNGSDR